MIPDHGSEPARAQDPALDVRHDTFTITRTLDAPPSVVFDAFADDTVYRRWFRFPGEDARLRREFGVGGGEDGHSVFGIMGRTPERLAYRSHYLDIVPGSRIVFTYESIIDDVVRWASLVTVLLADAAAATLLTWTEQVAFLVRTGDGSADLPHLRGGIALRLNGLSAVLGEEATRLRG